MNGKSYLLNTNWIQDNTRLSVINKKKGSEMNDILTQANKIIRKTRPSDDISKRINVFQRRNFLQLTFKTKGCRYSAAGSCSMCNYGQGVTPEHDVIMQELEEICNSDAFCESSMILLGASGSFLDNEEIPENLQYDIMNRISKSHMQEIYIETHYKSISDSKLQKIQKIFFNKYVHMEMGLETTVEEFQLNILNKVISLTELKNTIQQIHAHHLYADLNILFGMPFLTARQQIEDTLNSIHWALENEADSIIVFPINIQPYTVFEWWYVNGYITVPSLWGLFILLQKLSDKELSCMGLAWYGNRHIVYSYQKKTVVPRVCPICKQQLISFFNDFAENYNLSYRKKRMDKFNAQIFSCECRQIFINELENATNTDITSKLASAHKALERWVNVHAIE